MTIRAQPFPIGLDGLPSWFWLDGYEGQPIAASRHVHVDGLPNPQPGCPGGPAADEDIGVHAWPATYDWQFADDQPNSDLTTTSFGVPYPQQPGAVTHQYEETSRDAGQPAGFPVRVVVHFRVEFRVGDGTWQTLRVDDRQATLMYKVQQAYPVIVGQ